MTPTEVALLERPAVRSAHEIFVERQAPWLEALQEIVDAVLMCPECSKRPYTRWTLHEVESRGVIVAATQFDSNGVFWFRTDKTPFRQVKLENVAPAVLREYYYLIS